MTKPYLAIVVRAFVVISAAIVCWVVLGLLVYAIVHVLAGLTS